MPAKSIRERVRAEIADEIRAVARRHLATEGANISLRAVAREAGMVPSALYRYFDGRDALLTALITDAYEALAVRVAEAERAVPRDRHRERWLALCRAVRSWALDHPAEYALIYGSPVPGYAAPADTVGPAARILLALGGILYDSAAAGGRPPCAERPLPDGMRADLGRLIDQAPEGMVPEFAGRSAEAVLAVALALWTQLFGLVCFEAFGRLDMMIDARGPYFDHQILLMADLAGLGGPTADGDVTP